MGVDSKVESSLLWDAIREEARDNGAEVISMETFRNPEVWERRWGFKVDSYRMIYNLGEDHGNDIR